MSRRAVILASVLCLDTLCLIGLDRSPGDAKTCARTCVKRAAACRASECAGFTGKARRACAEMCTGRAGCRARIRTLAWVESECREVADGLLGRQKLKVRHGDCDPVTVMDVRSAQALPDPLGLCRIFGTNRVGESSPIAGVFQRLAVSPDGSSVLFEVTDDHSILPLLDLGQVGVQEGFFSVRADGSGLRSLGPPSRDPTFSVTPDASRPSGFIFFYGGNFAFSPNGRAVVFTDLGPGPSGEEAQQIVTLDLASGRRRPVTHLPSAPRQKPALPLSGYPVFVDDETIQFFSYANPDHLNPEGAYVAFTVRTDGSRLRALAPVSVPGSRVVPSFHVTGGGGGTATTLLLPGTPLNPMPGLTSLIAEVFLLDGRNLLQLTNFRRTDTIGGILDPSERRVLLEASADPFGTNPTQNCQFFSVDTLGGSLRQLTSFSATGLTIGCAWGPPPGCNIGGALQDPVTQTIVFYATCDPLGTNPNGGQLFTMRPNGSRPRQLTATPELTTNADGFVTAELPGPFSYSSR